MTNRWYNSTLWAVAWIWLLALGAPAARAREPSPLEGDDWQFDVVVRKGGREPLHGLVVRQTRKEVHVKWVYRRPGKPTVVLKEILPKSEVARVNLLGKEQRAKLKERLEQLERERDLLVRQVPLWNGGKVELPEDERLELKEVPWGAGGKAKALAYESTHFRLVSDARKDIVHLTAIQLEQIFTAYAQCLPPRRDMPRPTTITLTRSLEEYLAIVVGRGLNIRNPAFFDPRKNEVVCGSNLERLAEQLREIGERHKKELAGLEARRKKLVEIYGKGKVPAELTRPLDDSAERIRRAERRNEGLFRQAHEFLVRRLFHEAFHAYLARAVFADETLRMPRWFDEGLAQVFEAALVEAGELRVRRVDKDRLGDVRAALANNTLVPLKELLRAAPAKFQVTHTGDRTVEEKKRRESARYYLASWALAFYLTFEKRVLDSDDDLEDYLKDLQRGTDPLEAFRALVGQPLDEFETEFHEYLAHLDEDGLSAASR